MDKSSSTLNTFGTCFWDKKSAIFFGEHMPAPEILPQGFTRVTSNTIHAVAFFPDTQSLGLTGRMEVIFTHGARCQYEGVPADLYHEVANSESVGKAFKEKIMDEYIFTRIPQPWPDVLNLGGGNV